MLGFREAKEALLALPREQRMRVFKMVQRAPYRFIARFLLIIFAAILANIIIGLIVAWLATLFAWTDRTIIAAIAVLTLPVIVCLLITGFKQTFRFITEIAKELQQARCNRPDDRYE